MDYMKVAMLVLLAINAVMLLLLILRKEDSAKTEKALLALREDVLTKQRLFAEDLLRALNEQHKDNLASFMQLNQNNLSSLEAIGKLLEEKLASMERRVEHVEQSNEQRLEGIRGVVEQKLEELRKDNNAKLDLIRGTVDEKLQSTLEQRIAASFDTVTRELKRVYEGLGEMRKLATGVDSLKKILGNVKTRGILGEVQLGAILEEILAPEQYARDVVTVSGTKNRVEYAIRMPGQDGSAVYLPIDAKFPADLYAKLQEAKEGGSKEVVEACYKALEARIREEARDIHSKYIAPPETTEFAIMFLPFEGLYAEVVSRGMLQELQQKYQVTITGPSTMAAFLNSLRMGFRTLAIQQRSSEVWQILGAVKHEFSKFQDGLKAMKGHLDSTSKDLDKLMTTRTNVISRRLSAVESLDEEQSRSALGLGERD